VQEDVWQRRRGAALSVWERAQPDPEWRRVGEGRYVNRWGEEAGEYLERRMWGWDAGEWPGSPPERAYRERRRADQG
jgi:hypothetical protein